MQGSSISPLSRESLRSSDLSAKLYGPIPPLLSDERPPQHSMGMRTNVALITPETREDAATVAGAPSSRSSE